MFSMLQHQVGASIGVRQFPISLMFCNVKVNIVLRLRLIYKYGVMFNMMFCFVDHLRKEML